MPLTCLILTLLAWAAAGPGGAAGQSTAWYVGGAVSNGEIPSPFRPYCSDHVPHGIPIASVGGPGIHGSMVRSSGLDLSLRLSMLFDGSNANCVDGSWPEDGVYTSRLFEGDVAGRIARAAELGMGYSPPVLPVVRASVGVGWLVGGTRPYGIAAVGLRFGGRFRLLADWSVRHAAVPYVVYSVEWQDGEVVDTERSPGLVWASGSEFRLGLDYRLR